MTYFDNLHGDIINIPARMPACLSKHATDSAYKMGHRDARHAAAELVSEDNLRERKNTTWPIAPV